jgi:hypothetical protein
MAYEYLMQVVAGLAATTSEFRQPVPSIMGATENILPRATSGGVSFLIS